MGKDRRQLFLIGDAADRQRLALAARTAGPANAMDVGFNHLGEVVIDHETKSRHIDPARRHIGGDKDAEFTLLETAKHLLADILAHVAVKGVGANPLVRQPGRQLVRAKPCAHENQGLFARHPVELAEKNVTLVGIAYQHGTLADGVDGFTGAFGLDRHRIGQEGLGKAFHLVRHRGREEHRLTRRRQRLENAPDGRQETQIDHLVALVEDEMLDVVEIDLAAGHQILEASRGRDKNVDTLFQRTELVVIPFAADDGQIAHLQTAGKRLDAVRHLVGKFARRHKHKDAGAPWRACLAFLEKTVEQRQKIGGRLAGSGLRKANQVAPLEDHRDGIALDRRRNGQPLRGNVVDNAWRNAKLEERVTLEGRLRAVIRHVRIVDLLRLVNGHQCPFRFSARTALAVRRHPSTAAHEGSHRC